MLLLPALGTVCGCDFHLPIVVVYVGKEPTAPANLLATLEAGNGGLEDMLVLIDIRKDSIY